MGQVVAKRKDAAAGSTAAAIATTADDELAAERHRHIEEAIALDRAALGLTLKILLLGGPASGKSTIFKQMRILHLNGFTDMDRVNYRYMIFGNIFQAATELLDGCRVLKLDLDSRSESCAKQLIEYVAATAPWERDLDAAMALLIKELWASDAFGHCFHRRTEVQLLDSAKYFLDDVERIARADYEPTDQDVIRARTPTTGLHEIHFPYKSVTLRVIDVGGQKSEQRKWIHCFESVHGILFIAALSDYELATREDAAALPTNAMHNSLAIFSRIVNSHWFGARTAFVLFLNKVDVFEERIGMSPLKACFPDYKGPNKAAEALRHIHEQFDAVVDRAASKKKVVYTHYTNATDTRNVDRFFGACMDVVLKNSMEKIGFA